LKAAGYSCIEAKAAGFLTSEAARAGYGADEAKDAGFFTTIEEAKAAGYVEGLKAMLKAMLKAGGFSGLKEMKEAVAEMKEAGYTTAEIKEAGYTAAEFKEAGYTAVEMKEAGYTAAEIKEVGYTAAEIKEAGYTTFASAFDTNGVLHHIGTAGGREAYRNPQEAGRVVAAVSSVGSGRPQLLVQHQHDRPVSNSTQNEPNSWMSVDLGEGRSLRPDHYCLRHDNTQGGALRNWRLEGSHDGRAWVALRTHTNDASIVDEGRVGEWPAYYGTWYGKTAVWPVDCQGAEAFRHFRILQMGKNSSASDDLHCAGIELYGTFRGPAA
jgi:hypothetical protein